MLHGSRSSTTPSFLRRSTRLDWAWARRRAHAGLGTVLSGRPVANNRLHQRTARCTRRRLDLGLAGLARESCGRPVAEIRLHQCKARCTRRRPESARRALLLTVWDSILGLAGSGRASCGRLVADTRSHRCRARCTRPRPGSAYRFPDFFALDKSPRHKLEKCDENSVPEHWYKQK